MSAETLSIPLAEMTQPSPELPDWLNHRIEQAVEDSDFIASPELREGIAGFYKAHYGLASLMEVSLGSDESLTAEMAEDRTALQQLIDTSQFSKHTLEKSFTDAMQGGYANYSYVQQITPLLARIRLARLEAPADIALRRAELMTLAKASTALFAEASVGVTTVSTPESDLVASIRKQVEQKLEASGLFTYKPDSGSWIAKDLGDPQYPQTQRSVHLTEDPFYSINRNISTFWSDCRNAGQLLFHNTGHLHDVVTNGKLMPRRMQQEQYGKTNIQTADSLDGHVHSPTPHWSEQYDQRTYRAGADAGTIAMPLWKIIQAAPYARDAQYGVVTLKPDSSYAAGMVPVNNKAGSIGFGGEDIQGRSGMDRTFYASPYDVSAEAPIDKAPDGYSLPLGGDSYLVRLATDEPLDATISMSPHTIQIRPYEDEPGTSRAAWNERQRRLVGNAIKSLQATSIQARAGEYVVPLRTGVMNFYVPDDGSSDDKPRASFTKLS